MGILVMARILASPVHRFYTRGPHTILLQTCECHEWFAPVFCGCPSPSSPATSEYHTILLLQQPGAARILTIARSAPFSSDAADMFYVIFAAHCPIKASQDTFQLGPLGFQAVHSICSLCKPTFAAEDAFISA